MSQLEKHKKEKERKVNGWDIISTGLGLGAMALVGVCFMQAKNPVNALRLPAAFALLGASVAAEKMRETDLLSLNDLSEYETKIRTAQLETVSILEAATRDIETAEDYYSRLPQDRWDIIHGITEIAPPALEARQADTLIQTIEQPKDQPLPDPSAGYDPEGSPWDEPEEEAKEPETRSSFIPKERVDQWFAEMGDNLPQSLRNEWNLTTDPKGIEVIDNQARILKDG